MPKTAGFATTDYVVFISVLVITPLIGIFYAIKDRKVKNVDNYQFGNRKMSPIAVGLSLAVSYISAITLIGYPADAYLFGTINMWYSITGIIATFITCLYYIPLMRRVKLQTMNQYLEYRFNSKVRKFVSFYSILQGVLNMGVYIYLPPLSISALTPLSFDASVLITSGVVILYTTVGGFKAVIWTETLQSVIMLAGAIATFIRALIVVGGFREVWDAAERGGRINHWDFSLDPTLQRTFWTIIVGFSMTLCGSLCYTQASLQRYQSCKSTRDARIASVIANIPFFIFYPICILTGYVAYAYFETCDPYLNGEIQKYDQMIPLLVSEIFRDAPGMTGLFVAAIYCGTLSNLSSGINAMGTLIVQDMLLPLFPHFSQTKKLTLSKITVVCIGITATAIAFGLQFIKGNFLPIAITISGSFSGPTMGLFTLAIFFPWANAKGVVTGTVVALAISCWTAIGALIHGIPPEKVRALPGSVQNCSDSINKMTSTSFFMSSAKNLSTLNVTTAKTLTQPLEEKPHLYFTLYALSYQYYILFGFMICVIVGIIVSFLTKPNSPSKMDPDLFVPLIDNKRLPKKVRTFFRFGVPEEAKKQLCEKDEEIIIPEVVKENSHSTISCEGFENNEKSKFLSTYQ